jgi:hypothetical protein
MNLYSSNLAPVKDIQITGEYRPAFAFPLIGQPQHLQPGVVQRQLINFYTIKLVRLKKWTQFIY